jgi:phospholipid-translocating ATPase
MVITWIVIIGSSVILMLWILVYSFFQSSDFVNEVEILFSSMLFWATWILALVLALRTSDRLCVLASCSS